MKPYGIIYKATNVITNESYIGKTTLLLEKRWSQGHVNTANRGKDLTNYFHNAIRKYGSDKFVINQICECKSKEILNLMETFYIMVHHTHYTEGGYNLTCGGDGQSPGYRPTEETKKKQSLSLKGRIITPEHAKKIGDSQRGEKNHMWGKVSPNRGRKDMFSPEMLIKLGDHHRKYPLEKKPLAREMRKSGKLLNEIVEELHLSYKVVQKWCKDIKDIQGFENKRLLTINMRKSGISPKKIAEQLGISCSFVYRYCKNIKNKNVA